MSAVTVDQYILKAGKWTPALNMLREVMLALELEEDIKWGMPAYLINGKNILGLAHFKSYTGIWFHQGIFLKDREGVLEKPPEGTAKAMRQWRFYSADEIENRIDLIVDYVRECIQNSKDGRVLKNQRRNEPFKIPVELQEEMKRDRYLKTSFEALTYAKRRDYSNFIGSAKKSETRILRLKRCLPLIREGKGVGALYGS